MENIVWQKLTERNVQRTGDLIFKRLRFNVQMIFINLLPIFGEIIIYVYITYLQTHTMIV